MKNGKNNEFRPTGGGNKNAAAGRETRENRENREPRERRENRETRESRENRETRENRTPREMRENREPRGGKNLPQKDSRVRKNTFVERDKNKNGGGRDKNSADGRKDTYVYVLDGNLYINLTNKCSNGCSFCVRNERASYYGNYLWLRHGDPTAEKVIAAIGGLGDIKRFKEAVFCGFGEPTYKMAELAAVADWVHAQGLPTRLNTNGQGNLINKRDIVPELKGRIDLVNVSLNASSAEKYQPICRSMFGENGFAAMIEFTRLCKRNGVNCRFSVVDCIGEEEVAACKRLAEGVGVPLYVRKYITDS